MYEQRGLTPAFVESVLIRLIRTPQATQEVLGILLPEHFTGPDEAHYSLLWRAAQTVYTKYGHIGYDTLYDTVQLMAATTTSLSPIMLEHLLSESAEAPGILRWAFHTLDPAKLELGLTREMTRAFLSERYVMRPLVAAVESGQTSKLPDIIADVTVRQQRMMQVDVNPVVPAMPDNWAPTPTFVEPTGLAYFDVFMDGGHAPGEVNGILGPMGTGKTMLAVNLAISTGRFQLALPSALIGKPKRVYLVTYEQSAEEIRKRLLACAAQIAFATLKEMTDPAASFSSKYRGDYKPYEQNRDWERYGGAAVERPGELERYERERPLLRDVVQIIDLSGIGTQSRSGNGYVEEVSALISADQNRNGNPGVACVIVDYVLLAAKRYMAASNMDESKNCRHVVGDYVDRIKQQVAGRFSTPVWLLHQLNSDGNKGHPAKPTTHNQASESGAFAAALTFCACLSTKDVETSCCLLNFSKRRRAGDNVPCKVLHIIGAEASIVDGDEHFVANPMVGKIVRREFADQFGGVSEGTANETNHTTAHNTSPAAVLSGT